MSVLVCLCPLALQKKISKVFWRPLSISVHFYPFLSVSFSFFLFLSNPVFFCLFLLVFFFLCPFLSVSVCSVCFGIFWYWHTIHTHPEIQCIPYAVNKCVLIGCVCITEAGIGGVSMRYFDGDRPSMEGSGGFICVFTMAPTLVRPWSWSHPCVRGLTSNKQTRTNMSALVWLCCCSIEEKISRHYGMGHGSVPCRPLFVLEYFWF